MNYHSNQSKLAHTSERYQKRVQAPFDQLYVVKSVKQ